MYSMVEQVGSSENINLAVAAVYGGKDFKRLDIDGIVYFLLPSTSNLKYQKTLEPLWQKICDEFKPDIVHIHGTEFPHGLACMRSSPDLKYAVSIQGLVGIIARYYYAAMSSWDILTNITFRDIVRFDTIFQSKRSFQRRDIFEKEYIRRANAISGRTSWDHAHCVAVNPKAYYHFCNRTLRSGFYTSDKWDIENKTDYSIFLSQSVYPIKGLHQVIKAAALLKSDFPNISLRVAGYNIIKNATISEKLRLSGYGAYILSLVKKFYLQENIHFLGTLDEQKMIDEYRNAHLFICPSSIDNSPNSLGEAQMLGVPSIASYVGGVPDMVTEGVSGLMYRFEEVEMLAENIRKVFLDNDLAIRLSLGGIEAAGKRHFQDTNLEHTLEIYRKLGRS